MKNKTNSKKTKGRTINYFSVKDGKFIRVYARLLKLTPHEMKIAINDQAFIIPSSYDLTKMLSGNILSAFRYTKNGETKLYPLPFTSEFDESHARDVFISADGDNAKLVYDDPEVKRKIIELNRLKAEFLDYWELLQDFAADQVEFSGMIPMPTITSGSPVKQAGKGGANYINNGGNSNGNEDKRKRIPVLKRKSRHDKKNDKKIEVLFSKWRK